MQTAAQQSGFSLPSSYFLVDISFLNFYEANDKNETLSEWNYWHNNPDKGLFIFWQTLGTEDNATDPSLSEEMRFYLTISLEQWLSDPIAFRVETLHEMLHTTEDPSGQSLVYYAHCNCGCDRTGEMMGSYALRWLNMSWEQVNAWNTKIAGRPMGCHNYLAMQWYCLWLNQRHALTNDCLTNFPCHPD